MQPLYPHHIQICAAFQESEPGTQQVCRGQHSAKIQLEYGESWLQQMKEMKYRLKQCKQLDMHLQFNCGFFNAFNFMENMII
jgi:hypothetical protein